MLGTRLPQMPTKTGLSTPMEGSSVGFRPEDVKVREDANTQAPVLVGTVELVEPLGADTYVTVKVGEDLVRCRCGPTFGPALDSAVYLEIDPAKIHLFGPDGNVIAQEPADDGAESARIAAQ